MSTNQSSMLRRQGSILGRYIVCKSSTLVSLELIPSAPSSLKSECNQHHVFKSLAWSFSFHLTTLLRILMQHQCFCFTVSQYHKSSPYLYSPPIVSFSCERSSAPRSWTSPFYFLPPQNPPQSRRSLSLAVQLSRCSRDIWIDLVSAWRNND